MIGTRIKQRRKELNLTQSELAKRMGYTSTSTITKIETGVNDIPLEKVSQFASALGTTTAELMGWEQEHRLINYYDRLTELIDRLDDADRARLEERVETMLEAEKYQ